MSPEDNLPRRLSARDGAPASLRLGRRCLPPAYLPTVRRARPVNLGVGARHVIYRAHLRVLQQLPVRAFGIVVDKRGRNLSPAGCFDLAWEGLLQRLERTSSRENVTFVVIHDEGENDAVRRWVRRARRYLTAGSAFGTGGLQLAARLLIDEPVPRRSSQSYFIQAADLVAYAAFRAVVPPSAGIARICPEQMWDEIGPATHKPVSSLKQRSRPGIVLR